MKRENVIRVKYFSDDYVRLNKDQLGDWIDLNVDRIDEFIAVDGREIDIDELNRRFKAGEPVHYKAGDVIRFGLGVAIKMPEGYEAHIAPRSSTFKYWKFLQTNAVGVVDNSYSGDNDEWLSQYIAMGDGHINRFDAVCQFRLLENQFNGQGFSIIEVDKLDDKDRGGYGVSGKSGR